MLCLQGAPYLDPPAFAEMAENFFMVAQDLSPDMREYYSDKGNDASAASEGKAASAATVPRAVSDVTAVLLAMAVLGVA